MEKPHTVVHVVVLCCGKLWLQYGKAAQLGHSGIIYCSFCYFERPFHIQGCYTSDVLAVPGLFLLSLLSLSFTHKMQGNITYLVFTLVFILVFFSVHLVPSRSRETDCSSNLSIYKGSYTELILLS